MPRNGSGQYDLPYDWNDDKANGIKVLASRMQTQDEDIGTALTGSVAADGQTPLTGNLDFNGNKCVDLADGSDAGDSINVSQAQTGELQFYGVSTTTSAGTDGLNYDLGPTPSITVYPTYTKFSFVCHFTCIANPIMRFGSLATKTLKKSDGSSGYRALEAGDMIADKEYIGVLNDDISSTDIIIENPEDYSIQSGAAQAKTIATGAITVTKNYSSYVIDTEGSAASDDLDTISGGQNGQVIFIRSANSSRDINLTTSGNIVPLGNVSSVITDTNIVIGLRYDSGLAKWVAFSSNLVTATKSTNGYSYLPNGLIVQWGTSGSIASDSSTTVTFPISFPNNCFCVTQAPKSSSAIVDNWGMVLSFTTSQAVLARGANSGTIESNVSYWMAIGN